MRSLPIDRWLWLSILVLPLVIWLYFEPPGAPTEIEPETTSSSGPSEPGTDSIPATDTDNGQPPDVEGNGAVTSVEPPDSRRRVLKIRALSKDGEWMPAGTALPIENAAGPMSSGPEPQFQTSGTEYFIRKPGPFVPGLPPAAGGILQPLDLEPGNWTLDCTFQQPAATAPVQIPWLILARPEDPQKSARLIVAGQTPLPPGSRLLVQILDRDRVLDGGIMTISGPEIWWDREMVPREWFATLLTVRFQWRSSAASEVIRQRVQQQIWPPASRGEDWTWDGRCGVDDQQEAQRQADEIHSWFSQALNEVETSRDLLLVAGAKARGKRAGLLKDDDRVDRMLDHPLAPTIDRLGRGRNFDFARWRQLVDIDFPERWQVWGDSEAIPWPDRNPGAAKNIVLLFKTLDKYSRLESTVVYEKLGKPRHVHDFVADFDWEPVTERTQTLSKIRNFIASIRESIER